MDKCPFCSDEPLITVTSYQYEGSAYDMQGNELIATPQATIVTESCSWCESVVHRWLASEYNESEET